MSQEVYIERELQSISPAGVRRASWGAIFGGMFVTIAVQIMFTLLGLGIGIATVQTEQQSSSQQVVTASGIWFLVTGLISIWLGSFVAGRLSGGPRRADGMLHGVVTWSVSMAVMFALLATTVGAVLGGTASLLGRALSSNTSAGGNNEVSSLEQEIKGAAPQAGALLPPTGRTQGQSEPPGQLTAFAQQDPELAAALGRLEAKGGSAKDPQARDQVLNLLTSKHNVDPQQASSLLNDWDREFQQAHAQLSQKAQQVGQQAAKGIQWGAFGGFIALILGLLVSAWGGWTGTRSLLRAEPIAVPVRA